MRPSGILTGDDTAATTSKIYILAFDHRGSFQKKFFGIEGEPDSEQTAIIADAKHLIFEGMLQAVEPGADPSVTGVLVDEQFGSTVPAEARERGLILAMPAERSGQSMFDFQYGDDFGAHIEHFNPDFTKVLVRYNPDGDAAANREQLGKLRTLSDWLTQHERKFLFELLVPAEDAQLRVGRGRQRPLRRRAASGADAQDDRRDPGRRRRGRRVEDRGRGRARRLRDARRTGPLRWAGWRHLRGAGTRRR